MRALWGILALSSIAGSASAQTYVVAVGNDFGRADEPELRYAERDAERVAAVLRELGRVRPEHELVLRGADASELRTALLRTNATLRREKDRTALVVYYSGHAGAEGLHLGDTTMGFEELKAIVEASPARIRVLILDSCRSGGITQVKGVRPTEPFAIRLEDRIDVEGFAIITSSAESEDSQESDGLQASFFTHHLVNGLKGAADGDGDQRVSLQEAYTYAYRETLRSTGRTLTLQHPTYSYDLEGKGDFVLTYLADGKGRFGTLAVTEPGTYLVHAGTASGAITAEVRVDEGGTRLLLAPGRYFVQRRARTSYREYELRVERDRVVQLDALPYRDIRYARLLRKGGGAATVVHGLLAGSEVRGSLLDGYTATPSAILGYTLDLTEVTVGLQGRVGFAQSTDGVDAGMLELGLRVRGDRYFDFEPFSLSIGVFVEGSLLQQRFRTTGLAPDRDAGVLGLGLAVGLERAFGPWSLRLEGGPVSFVLRRAVIDAGAAVGDELRTPLTGWVGLGAGYRL